MSSIVNEGTKDYRVCRDTVFAGAVIKPNSIMQTNNGIFIPSYDKLRSTIFTINENGLAQDLLYNSPNYPVLGISKKELISKDEPLIYNSFSMAPLLNLYGFCNLLYYVDIITAKNIFFSGSFVEHNLELFGINKEALINCDLFSINGYNTSLNERIKELMDYIYTNYNFTYDEFSDMNLSNLIKKGRLPIELIDLIDQIVEVGEIQKSHKKLFKKADPFEPVKEEKNVKRLRQMF